MNQIRLKKIKNNVDCVELWNYLNKNPGVLLHQLEEVFKNDNWRNLRKTGTSFCSNLVYCLKKLRQIKAIDIIQTRNDGGEFSFSLIQVIAEPIIVDIVNLIKCSACGNDFKKKNSQSKYQDLCQECTKKKFMVSPEIECVYCKLSGPRNKMKSHMNNIYHKKCYENYLNDRKLQKEKNKLERIGKKYYCKDCGGELTFYSRRSDCCSSCNKKRRDNIKLKSHGVRFCYSCRVTLKGSNKTGLCGNDNCLAIFYCENNVKFKGAYFNSDQKSRRIKAKIIGLKCQICSYDAVLQYHHVIFKEDGGTDELNNIIALCPNHHQEVHKLGLDISEYHKQVLQRLEDIKNGVIVIK